SVAGIPLTELLDKPTLDRLVERTRNGGAEIVKYLKTGSAYYAPAAAAAQMVEAIVRDKKRVLPCAAYCDKEYGVGGLFVGVPVVLGAKGVERIVQLELTTAEQEAFRRSVEAVRNLVETMGRLIGSRQIE
ncbi:MAG TPA: malate dehydrogenase, partial [Thermoguttaceae bacterium]|nr:malate dehydrogenase [Thermoguttaceae bacterium]